MCYTEQYVKNRTIVSRTLQKTDITEKRKEVKESGVKNKSAKTSKSEDEGQAETFLRSRDSVDTVRIFKNTKNNKTV